MCDTDMLKAISIYTKYRVLGIQVVNIYLLRIYDVALLPA